MSSLDGKDAKTRKAVPLATGVVDYFPDALLELAELSRIGNDQHNPGQPLHWAKEKSNDHPDCLMRHFVDRGKRDGDGVRHSTKVLWRAAAILQLEIEAERRVAAAMKTMTGTIYFDVFGLENQEERRVVCKDRRHHDEVKKRTERWLSPGEGPQYRRYTRRKAPWYTP